MGATKANWMIYLYGILPCAGGLAFGYDTGSMSGILAMPQFLNYMDNPGNFLQGGITAAIQAGSFAGSLLTGLFLADRFGRRKTILIGSAVFTLGIVISAAAVNVPMLVVGRVINGLGNGCNVMMVPLYQSEIAPPSIRGRIISLQQCFINLGILIAFWLQYASSHVHGEISWRLPIAIQVVITVFLFVVMLFLPESPRWLIQQGREAEGLRCLAKVHASGDETKPIVLAEMQEMCAKIEWEKQNAPPSYLKMIFGSERRRTWLGIGVQSMQQITGISIIMYYAVFLFEQAGIGNTQAALLANGIQGLVLNVFVWPNMYWMDTWGRRRPAILGGIGMGISMAIIGILMGTLGNPHWDQLTQKTLFTFSTRAAGYTTIAFVYVYVACFSLSWGCVAWVYPNEIFSMNMRGRGTSLSSATNGFVNFWFALYIPTAMAEITWKLYIMSAGFGFGISTICYLLYPETAQKTLEEIDFLFTEDRSIFVLRDKDACKVGSLFERDLSQGEALVFGATPGIVGVVSKETET